MTEIPRRVTLQPNGTYIWSAELDMDIERKNYRTGGLIWVVIAAVIFLIGIIFLLRSHRWQPFLYITGFVIVILLITFGVVKGQENMGQMRRTYRLMDELIAARQFCANKGKTLSLTVNGGTVAEKDLPDKERVIDVTNEISDETLRKICSEIGVSSDHPVHLYCPCVKDAERRVVKTSSR